MTRDDRPIAAIATLVDHLAALPDRHMRAVVLAEHVADLAPETGADVLDAIVWGAVQQARDPTRAYLAMLEPERLTCMWASEGVARLEAAAMERGCVGALHWLRSARAESAETDSDDASTVERTALTLGERRALARRAVGADLDRLLRDPDPVVITNLLNNRRTTEDLVVRVCARRPVRSGVLGVVVRSSWVQRARVRLALVQNPHLSQRYALTLLVLLAPGDHLRIAADATLPPQVRLSAQRLLDWQGPHPRWGLR